MQTSNHPPPVAKPPITTTGTNASEHSPLQRQREGEREEGGGERGGGASEIEVVGCQNSWTNARAAANTGSRKGKW